MSSADVAFTSSSSSNVYLDANGGIPLSSAGLKAIERAGKCTNASNTNALSGREAEKEYLESTEKIKRLLLPNPDDWDLINTSGASEGIVTCLTSLSDLGYPVLVTDGAHPVVDATVARYKLKITKCERSEKGVEEAMEKGSYAGLFITHSISLTGELSDVIGMSSKFRKFQPGSPVIIDSTQVIGKIPKPLIVCEDGKCVDTVIFSSHKFGGAKGHGGVLLRRDGPMTTIWKSLIPGSQQEGRRGGTLNVMGASSCADALEEAMENIEKKHEITRIAIGNLIDEVRTRELPRIKLLAPLSPDHNIMNTILLSLPFCSKAFAKTLSERGYDVGTGTACQTNAVSSASEQHPYQIRISLPCGCSLDAKAFMSTFQAVYEETLSSWKEKLEKELDEIATDDDSDGHI